MGKRKKALVAEKEASRHGAQDKKGIIMAYSTKSKTKSSKAGKKPFKPCRGCPTKAACKKELRSVRVRRSEEKQESLLYLHCARSKMVKRNHN